jgi:hypothetical protein
MVEKVKLADGLEKTVTWVWLEDAQLKVEYYDFSEDAQRMFGNDVAYTLTVTEMDKLYFVAKLDEAILIQWLVENFKTYFAIKKWLEDNKIGFTVEIESHA